MFVPFFSTHHPVKTSRLKRRKGGGGGKSSSRGKSSSASSGSHVSKSSWTSFDDSTGGTAKTRPSPYSDGGGASSTIPAGKAFAGRSSGGGTRSNIYGTSYYGCEYSGCYGRCVDGQNFLFYFWPLAFVNIGGLAYLESEYGSPSNISRPGGIEVTAAFKSLKDATIYRILADNETVVDLIDSIHSNKTCSDLLTADSASTMADAASYNSSYPIIKREQIVQYYRSSSAALSVDGYNNTAVFSNITYMTPLPTGIDREMLDCLNITIGLAIPLVNDTSKADWNAGFLTIALVLVLFHWLQAII